MWYCLLCCTKVIVNFESPDKTDHSNESNQEDLSSGISNPLHHLLNNWRISSPDLNPFTGVGDWGVDGEEGKHTIIRCNAPDSFPHRTITWTKGGNQLPSQSSHRAISQEGDLHFAFLELSDAGIYVCTVTNVFITKKVVRTVSLFVSPGKYRIIYAF